MNIGEMCKKAHEIAVSKGWYDTEESKKRTLCEEIALMHSEIDEALECFRDPNHTPQEIWIGENGKPEGMAIELADVLIRMGDSIEGRKLSLTMHTSQLIEELGRLQESMAEMPVPVFFGGLHVLLSNAFSEAICNEFEESGLFSRDTGDSVGYWFSQTMFLIGALSHHLHLDLQAAVVMKMSYNANRPYRHGGKRA